MEFMTLIVIALYFGVGMFYACLTEYDGVNGFKHWLNRTLFWIFDMWRK